MRWQARAKVEVRGGSERGKGQQGLRAASSDACDVFFQAEDGIRDYKVTGVQTCALPISTYRSLAGRIRRARYMANISGARWQEAVDEHASIMAALAARDAERLPRLLEEQIGRASCRERG